MRIDFRKVRFVTSSVDLKGRPGDAYPEVLVVGRSNVGKSSLINALVGQKIAFSSKKAGKTKLLNFFLIDERFYLVDSPGYGSTGFATMNTISFSKMMESYYGDKRLKAIVLLVDFRREMGEDDLAFLRYLEGFPCELICVGTKSDMMNQKERALAKKRAASAGIGEIVFSDLSSASLSSIRASIASSLA